MNTPNKIIDVPIDGPPVPRTPVLSHECVVSGFRAIVLPPGDVELALKGTWHTANIMGQASRRDLLKVEGQDLTHLPGISNSLCWAPTDADLRTVCNDPGWELIIELDPKRTEALAHESLENRRLSQEFIFWRQDIQATQAASLLIEHVRRPIVDRLYTEGLMLAVASRALRLAAGGIGAPSTRGTEDRVARVVDFIEEHLEASVGVARLAEISAMSPWQFSRAFKARLGKSPSQYVLERRIERARRLLEERRLPLAEIAIACGFASQSHMTDVFRSKLGVTPGRYRRSVQG